MGTFYDAPNDYRNYLAHHGVKGMKWGVRKQYPIVGRPKKGRQYIMSKNPLISQLQAANVRRNQNDRDRETKEFNSKSEFAKNLAKLSRGQDAAIENALEKYRHNKKFASEVNKWLTKNGPKSRKDDIQKSFDIMLRTGDVEDGSWDYMQEYLMGTNKEFSDNSRLLPQLEREYRNERSKYGRHSDYRYWL